MLKRNPLSHVDGPITDGTRTALVRSLAKLLRDFSFDEAGVHRGDSSIYERQLRETVLEIARADRRRRSLVRKRTRAERSLEEIEEVLESILCEDARADEEFVSERDRLQEVLDEVALSIDQLDRDRRQLRKRRKKIETMLQSY